MRIGTWQGEIQYVVRPVHHVEPVVDKPDEGGVVVIVKGHLDGVGGRFAHKPGSEMDPLQR